MGREIKKSKVYLFLAFVSSVLFRFVSLRFAHTQVDDDVKPKQVLLRLPLPMSPLIVRIILPQAPVGRALTWTQPPDQTATTFVRLAQLLLRSPAT